MLRPTDMTPEQKRLNDRVWELRIKYNDFVDFDGDDVDDAIMDSSPEEFSRITRQFKNKKEYAEATTLIEHCINRGQEVPENVWKKICQTREDFKVALASN